MIAEEDGGRDLRLEKDGVILPREVESEEEDKKNPSLAKGGRK